MGRWFEVIRLRSFLDTADHSVNSSNFGSSALISPMMRVMQKHLVLFSAFVGCILMASLYAEDFKPDAGFIALFNGTDLTGWHHADGWALDGKTDAGDGRYTVKDGVLVGNASPGRVLLWTTKEFKGDFV